MLQVVVQARQRISSQTTVSQRIPQRKKSFCRSGDMLHPEHEPMHLQAFERFQVSSSKLLVRNHGSENGEAVSDF